MNYYIFNRFFKDNVIYAEMTRLILDLIVTFFFVLL